MKELHSSTNKIATFFAYKR